MFRLVMYAASDTGHSKAADPAMAPARNERSCRRKRVRPCETRRFAERGCIASMAV